MTILKPELLSPAGTLKGMRYAFAYGADAVYAGQPRYSLRVRNNEFSNQNLESAINEAHSQGKKFYLASNIVAHNNKVKTYLNDLEPVIAAKPDSLIMSDPGLIMMVRETWPDQVIHLSVQSNVVNHASVKFWQKIGVSRIILSRELSIEEIAEIREECSNIEIEVFVHGALCMAYSGRCLLAGYLNHRDANQGVCTNACRWKYSIKTAKEDEWGNLIADEVPQLGKGLTVNDTFILEEKERPGECMSIEEDAHGTYMFNSKDLCAIRHVKQFCEIGIDSLKIEGRTKSFFYAARTAQAYRHAIDDAVAGKTFDENLLKELEALTTRGYTDGFYQRQAHEDYQSYHPKQLNEISQRFVGEIINYDPKTGWADIDVKNHFEVNDAIEVMTPEGNHIFNLTAIESMTGEKLTAAPGGGYQVRIPLSLPHHINHGLLIRHER